MNAKTETTRFACVRHGNVAWSTGSVFPIWKKMHDSTGIIGSTGPDMTRYFSNVEEAVALVITAIDNIEQVQSAVLSRKMKAARIRDFLETWIKHRGGSWRQIEGRRAGERPHEYLIGEAELPYTREIEFGGVPHFLIQFNSPAPKPLAEPFCSANAPRLTEADMIDIIDHPPLEER
jgi:UDP-N-acetylglucosamine 4,6-dehydratase/5-epimerase